MNGQRARVAAVNAFLERQPRWTVALVATLVHGLLYLLPNHFHLRAPGLLPMTWLDRAVPFWPATVWIYWSDYALVFAGFSACRVPGSTARFVYALAALVLVGTSIHWLWPTVYPRDLYPLPGAGGPTAWLFTRFRVVDSPASCWPSLHVAASYLAAFAAFESEPRRARWLVGWATAIFVSTLTAKQHYFADGVAGLGFALLVWGVAVRVRVPVAAPLAVTAPPRADRR